MHLIARPLLLTLVLVYCMHYYLIVLQPSEDKHLILYCCPRRLQSCQQIVLPLCGFLLPKMISYHQKLGKHKKSLYKEHAQIMHIGHLYLFTNYIWSSFQLGLPLIHALKSCLLCSYYSMIINTSCYFNSPVSENLNFVRVYSASNTQTPPGR